MLPSCSQLKEMWYYLVVLFILLMSVGVYYHAIMYPSHLQIFGPGEFDTWSFWKIIYYPYFQIFGDLSLDYLEGTLASCSSIKTEWENDSNIERCPIEDWTVTAIAMVFLLIANLLVVNLIIAKFSSSFEEIRLKSLKQWRYERYSLVTEYSNRIPAPFNIFRLLWPCVNKCRKRKVLITDREGNRLILLTSFIL
ncbi:hypothetical protein FSP39_023874 [Pinctada imbricata]|uniref:Ion transport domain-containing protein n=1 Tax=Pinctada imbricata TaxID=66713 RepID=A0AA88Y169_PINIB|nr:hypothetical protein FSP39_023874 [Pinctada imbricata]